MATRTGIRCYCCFQCRNIICLHNDILTRMTYPVRHGRRAFLFSNAKNVEIGFRMERRMINGRHTVADVFCKECMEWLGLKYFDAEDGWNKCKSGKFAIEKFKIDLVYW